jgi:putative ABC transport system permease protein
MPPPTPAPPRPARAALALLVHRSLRGRPMRSALAIAGVATSTLLVLVLLAAMRSPILAISSYVSQPGVHLWVGPEGTDNLVRTSGFLPSSIVGEMRAIPGVAAADPLVRVFVRVTPQHGANPGHEPYLMQLAIGYRVPDGLGGPPHIVAGRAPRGESEIALDRAAAFRLGAARGDTLLVNGRAAALVGITEKTNVLATQLMFFDVALAENSTGLSRQVSLVALRLERASDSVAVARRIAEDYPWLAVLPPDQFLRNNVRETAAGVVPLLTLIAALGALAAGVLVALLMQGLVEDRRTDIAVLMAMGTGTGIVAAAFVLHAAVLAIIGGALGDLLSRLLALALDRYLPTVQLVYVPSDVTMVLLVVTLASVAGAVVPLARLRRIDPLEAFRA